jgi:hypothetical protein
MVDEESQDVASESAGGAPVNRDKRREPGVIDGEVSSRSDDDAVPHPAAEASQPDAPQPPPAASRAPRAHGFLWGALGGLIVSALALGGGYYVFASKADVAQADASRVAALEAWTQREDAAIADLDKRIGAPEGTHSATALATIYKRLSALEASNAASGAVGLDKRLGALEAEYAAEAPRMAAATQAARDLSGEVKDLRVDVDAARGEIPGVSARVAKLESRAPPAGAASPDLSALVARLDRLDAQLAAPKVETPAAPEKPAANDNPAAVAIVAEALQDKLAAGAPFPTELAALVSLGVEPAKLAALKALVNGAPTGRALAASFEAVRSRALAAAAPKGEGGILDRLLAHLRGLVQVRELNETAGDDPQALASQIEADSRRDDLRGALAAFAKLPEPSREAAAAWAAEAGSKEAAVAALQSIRDAAVARLAESGRP